MLSPPADQNIYPTMQDGPVYSWSSFTLSSAGLTGYELVSYRFIALSRQTRVNVFFFK